MAHFDKEICLVVLALVCGKVGVSAQKYPYTASPATVWSSAQRYADDGISSSAGGGTCFRRQGYLQKRASGSSET